jgi:hypothetical protein
VLVRAVVCCAMLRQYPQARQSASLAKRAHRKEQESQCVQGKADVRSLKGNVRGQWVRAMGPVPSRLCSVALFVSDYR